MSTQKQSSSDHQQSLDLLNQIIDMSGGKGSVPQQKMVTTSKLITSQEKFNLRQNSQAGSHLQRVPQLMINNIQEGNGAELNRSIDLVISPKGGGRDRLQVQLQSVPLATFNGENPVFAGLAAEDGGVATESGRQRLGGRLAEDKDRSGLQTQRRTKQGTVLNSSEISNNHLSVLQVPGGGTTTHGNEGFKDSSDNFQEINIEMPKSREEEEGSLSDDEVDIDSIDSDKINVLHQKLGLPEYHRYSPASRQASRRRLHRKSTDEGSARPSARAPEDFSGAFAKMEAFRKNEKNPTQTIQTSEPGGASLGGDRTAKSRNVDRSSASISEHVASEDEEEPVVISIEEKLSNFNKVVSLLNYSQKRAKKKPMFNYDPLMEQPQQLSQATSQASQKRSSKKMIGLRKGTVSSIDNKQLIHFFIDPKDTPGDIYLKKQVGHALSMGPTRRTQQDLEVLSKFFTRFSFFDKFKQNNDQETFLAVMKYVKGMGVERNNFIIEQGEEGDRFYVLLKGRFGVMKAKEIEVEATSEWNIGEGQLIKYLKCLYDNLESVMWSKVPFGDVVKDILTAFKQDQTEPKTRKKKRGQQDRKASMESFLSIQIQKGDDSIEKQSPVEVVESKIRRLFFQNKNRKLFENLLKLAGMVDYSKVFLSQEVTELNEGTSFGELALQYGSNKRQASVYSKDVCLVAYLERTEYQLVLQKASAADISRKLQFIKQNRLFQEFSSNKLHKLSYQMKKVRVAKGRVVYKEGDRGTGIFLVLEGEVKYTKKVPFQVPIASKTKNKWFVEQVKAIKANEKHIEKDIGFFVVNSMIGFEEIFRRFISLKLGLKLRERPDPNHDEKDLHHRRHSSTESQGSGWQGKKQGWKSAYSSQFKFFNRKKSSQHEVVYRDFTCVCSSTQATLLFVPIDEIQNLLRHCNFALVQKLFDERKMVLDSSLADAGMLASKVAGSGLISFDEYRANQEATENVKKQCEQLQKHQQKQRKLLQQQQDAANDPTVEQALNQSPKKPERTPSKHQADLDLQGRSSGTELHLKTEGGGEQHSGLYIMDGRTTNLSPDYQDYYKNFSNLRGSFITGAGPQSKTAESTKVKSGAQTAKIDARKPEQEEMLLMSRIQEGSPEAVPLAPTRGSVEMGKGKKFGVTPKLDSRFNIIESLHSIGGFSGPIVEEENSRNLGAFKPNFPLSKSIAREEAAMKTTTTIVGGNQFYNQKASLFSDSRQKQAVRYQADKTSQGPGADNSEIDPFGTNPSIEAPPNLSVDTQNRSQVKAILKGVLSSKNDDYNPGADSGSVGMQALFSSRQETGLSDKNLVLPELATQGASATHVYQHSVEEAPRKSIKNNSKQSQMNGSKLLKGSARTGTSLQQHTQTFNMRSLNEGSQLQQWDSNFQLGQLSRNLPTLNSRNLNMTAGLINHQESYSVQSGSIGGPINSKHFNSMMSNDNVNSRKKWEQQKASLKSIYQKRNPNFSKLGPLTGKPPVNRQVGTHNGRSPNQLFGKQSETQIGWLQKAGQTNQTTSRCAQQANLPMFLSTCLSQQKRVIGEVASQLKSNRQLNNSKISRSPLKDTSRHHTKSPERNFGFDQDINSLESSGGDREFHGQSQLSKLNNPLSQLTTYSKRPEDDRGGQQNLKQVRNIQSQLSQQSLSLKSQGSYGAGPAIEAGKRTLMASPLNERSSKMASRQQQCKQSNGTASLNASALAGRSNESSSMLNRDSSKIFAQKLKKENVIDEKVMKGLQDPVNLGELQKNLNTESSVLMRDLKSFLSLRNAEYNCSKRKELQNQAIIQQKIAESVVHEKSMKRKSPHKPSIVHKYNEFAELNTTKIETFAGNEKARTLYEGLKCVDPSDKVSNELAVRLMGIFQSLDVDHYYRKKYTENQGLVQETEKELNDRMNRSLDNHMDKIDEIFEEMDKAERTQAMKPKIQAPLEGDSTEKLNSSVSPALRSSEKPPWRIVPRSTSEKQTQKLSNQLRNAKKAKNQSSSSKQGLQQAENKKFALMQSTFTSSRAKLHPKKNHYLATDGDLVVNDYDGSGWKGSKVRESDKFKKQYRTKMRRKEFANAQTQESNRTFHIPPGSSKFSTLQTNLLSIPPAPEMKPGNPLLEIPQNESRSTPIDLLNKTPTKSQLAMYPNLDLNRISNLIRKMNEKSPETVHASSELGGPGSNPLGSNAGPSTQMRVTGQHQFS